MTNKPRRSTVISMHSTKLVVVGLGHVGSSVVTFAMASGLYSEIAVIDTKEGLALGEGLDHSQSTGVPGTTNTYIHEGTYDDTRDADVIICAAGASIVPDPDRPDYVPPRSLLAKVGAQAARDVMKNVSERTKEPVIIFITNPLDAVVQIASTEFDYPASKVLGTGTMLDSARLRWAIAQEINIDPKSVTGYMMGEHGTTAVPILSNLNVQGVSWSELERWNGKDLPSREDIKQRVVDSAYDVFFAKGWTDAGVARSANVLAKSVLLNERSVHPVCSRLDGEYGLGDISMSVPAVLGSEGLIRRLPPIVDAWEQEKLEESADSIRAVYAEATSEEA